MLPTAHSNRSASRRNVAVAIALGVAACSSVAACHEFRACYEEPCEPVAGDGGDGSAEPITGGAANLGGQSGQGGESGAAGAPLGGEGGAAGEGAVEFVCAAPTADCDESTLTGCETNLLSAVEHCGACRQRCYGVCVEGACSPFELLSLEVQTPSTNGIVQVDGAVLATSLAESPQLLRWSDAGGAETLVGEPWSFDALVPASDRVYLLGASGSQLSSLRLQDDKVLSENVKAKTAAVIADTLYAVDATGMPYERTASPPVRTNLPLPTAAADGDQPLLATDGRELALVVNHASEPSTYSAYFLTGSTWQLAHSGSGGKISQVRVLGRTMYFTLGLDSDEGQYGSEVEYEITRVDFDGGIEVVGRAVGVVSFELTDQLYVSRVSAYHRGGFLIIPLDDPSKSRELETAGDMLSLTYISPYFYFGLSHRTAFGRVRSWLE
jgi:hypothetical protein